jgi:NAD(P)-dependent dehydrogenase (short-subunit alcohol dehydrogenase family)
VCPLAAVARCLGPGIQAYARAKLLNVLWTSALAEREPAITVHTVNPGMAWTPQAAVLGLQRLAVVADGDPG